MFHWIFKKAARTPFVWPDYKDFEGAGVVFTDKTFVLAGWQPRKAMPKLSGIGGMRDGEESYRITALREMVEELYGCAEVPIEFIHRLATKFEPITVFRNDRYINVVYSFEDLEKMLKSINKTGIRSYFYEKPPRTLQDLVFKRKKSLAAEVESFALLPVALFNGGIIDPDFIVDVKTGIVSRS